MKYKNNITDRSWPSHFFIFIVTSFQRTYMNGSACFVSSSYAATFNLRVVSILALLFVSHISWASSSSIFTESSGSRFSDSLLRQNMVVVRGWGEARGLKKLPTDSIVSEVATEVAKTALKEQAITEGRKKTKLSLDQSDFMPSNRRFGFIGTYSISYNNIEPVNKKNHNHNLSFSIAYKLNQSWSLYSSISLSHQSQGFNIVRTDKRGSFHKISNLNIGAVHEQSQFIKFINRSSSTLNISLPVSERSRFDKHIASISASHFMGGYSWKGISPFIRLSSNYLWNTQLFSQFLNDKINRDWLLSSGFGLNYIFLDQFGLRFSYQADIVRSLDGSWSQSFGNNLSLLSNIGSAQISIGIVNNSYPENDRLDVGYYDKYQRIIHGNITYAF